MPLGSKLDFCDFLDEWAGPYCYHDRDEEEDEDEDEDDNNDGSRLSGEENEGRILLPWELLGPCLRILGHCLLGGEKGEKSLLLRVKAHKACKSLYSRAMHDVNPKAILAIGSLLRLVKMEKHLHEADYTEIKSSNIISI